MPIGYNCEFPSFAECIQAHRAKGYTEEEARRICGQLQAETEAKCIQKLHVLRRRR